MKAFFLFSAILCFNMSLSGQLQVNLEAIEDLKALEEAYVKSGEDSKGIDIINNYKVKYDLIAKAYEAKGRTFNEKEFNKMFLKNNPDIKLLFKEYRKALKMKVIYFIENDDFKSILNEAYPSIVKKMK